MTASRALLENMSQLRKVLNARFAPTDGTKKNQALSFVKVALRENGPTERLAIPRHVSIAQQEGLGTRLSWVPVHVSTASLENIVIFQASLVAKSVPADSMPRK